MMRIGAGRPLDIAICRRGRSSSETPDSYGFWIMSGSEAVQRAVSEAAQAAPERTERPQLQLVRKVEVDRSRDALLTDFGKTTLEDRYLLPGESYQDMFARVATAYADDADHAQRV